MIFSSVRLPHCLGQKRTLLLLLVILSVLLAGCAETGQMRDQPRYDPLEASPFFADGMSARPMPAGAVPYTQNDGLSPFAQNAGQPISPNSPVLTGLKEDGSPVQGIPAPVDAALLLKGKERYDIFCIACHGPAGEGNGRAVPFGVVQPPNLITGAARTLSTGEIFNIITNGQNKMFPYGHRVYADERWAVIAYLRALQLKNGPVDLASLTAQDLQSIESQP